MSISGEISKKIQDKAVPDASVHGKSKSNLYIDEKIIKKGETILAGNKEIPVVKDCIMVFADDQPHHNWGHPCRYLLYDAETHDLYDTVHARFPPHLFKTPLTLKPFNEPVDLPAEEDILSLDYTQKVKPAVMPSTGRNKYALLYSGTSNNRHVNDMELLYRTLINVHHFSPDNIYVLNFDGTTSYSSFNPPTNIWPGNNTPYTMKVNASGTNTELDNVFKELQSRVKAEDLLFIHTNNHGDGPSDNSGSSQHKESSLVTFSERVIDYTAQEFAEQIAAFPKIGQLLIMMEQCHSGGFGQPIINKSTAGETCFISACEADKLSMGGKNFDPFARAWISGSAQTDIHRSGNDPDTDQEANAADAFNFAEENSKKDTPVLMENPKGCGKVISLFD